MFQSTFACFSAKYQNMKGWLVLQIFFKLIEVIIFPFSFLATFLVRCDQWFLQTMCSGTKEEKPLRATVCFSIEHARPRDAYVKKSNGITSSCFAGNIGDLNIQRQDGNENVPKTIGLIQAKQQLCTCITLFFAFLCRFQTTTTWKCLISRYCPLEFNSSWVHRHLAK